MSQSYEGGDNVDLMKFFEGVRNYQKWHEGVKKESIERLKQQANRVYSQLSLQRGFAVSSIVKILDKYNVHNSSLLFSRYENSKTLERILSTYDKMSLVKKREGFTCLKMAGMVGSRVSLKEMFSRAAGKRVVKDVKDAAVSLSTTIRNFEIASHAIAQRIKVKNNIIACFFFSRLNNKPAIVSSKYTQGFNQFNNISKCWDALAASIQRNFRKFSMRVFAH